jgi:hypothetical protein
MGASAMKWILLSVIVSLMGAIAALQIEVNELRVQLAKAASTSDKTAAAVRQFEKDVFAKLQNDEVARKTKEAQLDAARRRTIDDGLRRLPTGDRNKPMRWGQSEEGKPNL